MPDDTISPLPEESDAMSDANELRVVADTLSIDGVDPDVGDPVTTRVSGTVTSVVNGVVTFRVEAVNDQPMPAKPSVPRESEPEDEMARLERMALA